MATLAERLEAEGETRGAQRGRQAGLATLVRIMERRLERAIADAERTVLLERLNRLGPSRLGDVVLDLSSRELADWLSDPTAT